MIINHNWCIKLVPLVIFIYDARSHIHKIRLKYLKSQTGAFMCVLTAAIFSSNI